MTDRQIRLWSLIGLRSSARSDVRLSRSAGALRV